ncbi:copper homeostasis protein CutC [Nocardioides pocheonensis]|uniref:Copper homeostasis protein cutC homolog n=1 Tax=Nocardioides pocheonensis TaxID=661485 RepID=A0A3N0GYP1_9ACTN|nr:copper homeostasis protein CutC [Nocardioides pocheonensis]RNM17595.1 copper homeostasis protein CutC [Nocardioides pocheonensis]
MTIVSPDPEPIASSAPPALLSDPLLEVVVLHPRDAEAATVGQADRLLALAEPELGGRSPEPAAVSAILRETDLPVRVLLRLEDGLGLSVEGLTRLAGLARDYLTLGAQGVVFGFLDRDLEIDRTACSALAQELAGTPWTFARAFDAALYADRAWRDVRRLPGLDGVSSAGSTRGFAAGGDELLRRCAADPDVAALLVAAGGLTTEHVPWLIRTGVRQFSLGEEARPDGSWSKAYVAADYVRAWRMLLDDAHQRALGVPVD